MADQCRHPRPPRRQTTVKGRMIMKDRYKFIMKVGGVMCVYMIHGTCIVSDYTSFINPQLLYEVGEKFVYKFIMKVCVWGGLCGCT